MANKENKRQKRQKRQKKSLFKRIKTPRAIEEKRQDLAKNQPKNQKPNPQYKVSDHFHAQDTQHLRRGDR